MYDVLISSLVVKPIKSSLFWGSEIIRFTLDHRIPSEYCELDTLVLPPRSFKINNCVVKKRKESIDESSDDVVQWAVITRVDVVNIANNTK